MNVQSSLFHNFIASTHLFRLLYILFILILFLCTFYSATPPTFIYLPLGFACLAVIYDMIGELRKKQIGSNVFFVAATIVALIAHEERAIMIVLLILLVANYLHHLIEERTERAIEELIHIIPQEGFIIDSNGNYVLVPLSTIKPNDLVVVKTGCNIPVDGIIIQGNSNINEALLTGESIPKHKTVHDLVFAGTCVEDGSIILKTLHVGQETALGKISQLIEQTRAHKAPIISFADKIAWYVTLFFIVFIIITWFITHDLTLITTLLVFGSPIELTLVTPLTVLAGIACAFKNGVIVKGGLSLEHLAQADVMVFDKTGTLTMGEPRITNILIFNPRFTQKDIVLYAAIAEKRSGHVVAKAILKKAEELGISVPEPSRYISITGHGVEITFEQNRYLVGNRHFIEAPEHGNIVLNHGATETQATTIYLAQNNTLCGALLISDEIRADAKETINALKNQGIATMLILSGDRQTIAQQVGNSLGIPNTFGEVMPEKKLSIISSLQEKGHIVAMVGDGINDAPALRQATVGIAMGAMGTETAIEAANIVLMSNNLHVLVFIHRLAKNTLTIIKQNVIWGLFFTHALGIILGLLRLLTPVQAAIFHAVPEMLIFLNTARVLFFRP